MQVQRRTLAGGKHHDRHDALAIDQAIWSVANAHLTGITPGSAYKFGSGAGVQAQFVDDGDIAARHCRSLWQIAVANLDVLQLRLERGTESFSQIDGAVMAARAADGDRDIGTVAGGKAW